MEEFLLLGQIPGTDIVVTFGMWMLIVCMLVILAGLVWAQRHQQLIRKMPVLLDRIAL